MYAEKTQLWPDDPDYELLVEVFIDCFRDVGQIKIIQSIVPKNGFSLSYCAVL